MVPIDGLVLLAPPSDYGPRFGVPWNAASPSSANLMFIRARG